MLCSCKYRSRGPINRKLTGKHCSARSRFLWHDEHGTCNSSTESPREFGRSVAFIRLVVQHSSVFSKNRLAPFWYVASPLFLTAYHPRSQSRYLNLPHAPLSLSLFYPNGLEEEEEEELWRCRRLTFLLSLPVRGSKSSFAFLRMQKKEEERLYFFGRAGLRIWWDRDITCCPPLPLHSYREPPTEFCLLLLPRRPRKFIQKLSFFGELPTFFLPSSSSSSSGPLYYLLRLCLREREGRGEETDARSLRAEKTNYTNAV